MAESSNEKLFRTKVLPIMDKVMADLRHKQAEEIGRHTRSLSYIMAGAAGPDGGMSAQAASLDSLRYTGKWNSKHTEDYINMVKAELKKQHITVTPEIEKMMINKMIKDEVPKSSIEYIMRKAATNTIFYLPQTMSKSPLENHITEQAEKRYNPSALEKGTGYALGATADFLSMGGFGGGWSSAAKFVGVDVGLNAALDHFGGSTDYTPTGSKVTSDGKKKSSGETDVPMIIAPEYREQYLAEQAKKKTGQAQTTEQKPKANNNVEDSVRREPTSTPLSQTTQTTVQEPPQQTNQSGWTGLLSSFGLNGMSDIGHNLGYILAMLPDMLLGAFTGKTKSLGLKDNMMPIAAVLAGMFVKNPLLKMTLIGMGGANLLNKAGHEALANKQEGNESNVALGSNTNAVRYKSYPDEPLDTRITNPVLQGNCLVATIDKVPYTIQLSEHVVGAYQAGALPLNTLANSILAKSDQMRQVAGRSYGEHEVRNEAMENAEQREVIQRSR